jgi:hypothetical protein
MASKIVTGSKINYTCIPIDDESYQYATTDIHPSVYGCILDRTYYPAEDPTQACANDWTLPVVSSYNRRHWVIINKHPSDVYYPMTHIVMQDHYVVKKYDIWDSDVGLVAVVTETDED